MLRPVGTCNHKYGTTVSCLQFNPERRYSVEDIEAHLPPEPPPIIFTPASGTDPNSVISRARAYIAKIPGAVSEQNGHNDTFHVACVLVLGFGLSVDDAFPLLAEWNQTCQPPWEEKDLLHKLQSADQRTDERGYLLREDQPQASPAPASSNGKPRQKQEAGTTSKDFPLTDTGLAERFALQHGDDVRYCHAWGKWLVWDGTRWKIDDGGMVDQLGKQTVRSILREAADEPDDDTPQGP